MYHIVLDTNILHQEGLYSNDMRILKNLIDAGLVSVHIPSIVAQEFITKRITSVKEESAKIIKALDAFDKEGRRIDTVIYGDTKKTIQELAIIEATIEEKTKKSFDSWVKELKINILQPQQENFLQVFNDYFSGQGVFRQIKSRDDIPDAFINISLELLTESVGDLIVIIKDDRLKKHLDKNEKIKTLPELRELFDEKGLEETLASEKITKFIFSEELSHSLISFLDAYPNYFESFNEESDSIPGDTLIGVRVYNINIELETYDSLENFNITDVRKISQNKFSANFTFTVDSGIGYVTDYGSYLDIVRLHGRKPDCWSMNGEGWCDIVEDARLRYFGDLTIELTKEYEQIDSINIFDELENKNIIITMSAISVQIVDMI
ncbi:PIN domain-containing protein [Rahnella aceris]